MSYSPGQNYRLSYTIAIALAFHAVAILLIAFNAGSKTSTQSQMEVTLSYHNSDEKPDNADFIAASNQQGSGDSKKNTPLTTKYQSDLNDNSINPVASLLTPEIPQPQQNIVEPRIITTEGDSQRALNLAHSSLNHEEMIDANSDKKTLTELSQAIASLEARLADKQQLLTKGPRVLTLSSASTIEAADANYIHQWRDRVERIGNRHYPQAARDKGLYGDVRLLVRLKASGVVEEISILSSSGSKVLDRAAIESIRLASPFEPFTQSLAKKYDRIDVIRTWQFRKNKLSAKAD